MNTAYEPESFFTASQRKTTRPLYVGILQVRTLQVAQVHERCNMDPLPICLSLLLNILSTFFHIGSSPCWQALSFAPPFVNGGFCIRSFHRLADGWARGFLRKIVKSNGIVPSVSTAVIMTLQYHFLDYSIFVTRELQVCARFFTHCFVDQFQWTGPRVCWRKRPTRADQLLINKKLGSERSDLPCNYSEASLWLSRATS